MFQKVQDYIRNVPNFPKLGIQFKDITPLLSSETGFELAIDWYVSRIESTVKPDKIVGIESRGFIFGAAIAYRMNIGFVPIRKPGKLPAKTISQSYDLEYGSDTLQVHQDAFGKNTKVALVDDLLATGGTAQASVELIQKLGGKVTSALFLIELDELQGRNKLTSINDSKIFSLLHY